MSWFVVIWSGAVIVLCIAVMWVTLRKIAVMHTKTGTSRIDIIAFLVIAFGSLFLLLAELDIWNIPDWLFVMIIAAVALLLELAEQRRPKEERSRGWIRIVPWFFVAYMVINMLL